MKLLRSHSTPSPDDIDHDTQGVSSNALGSSLRACRCTVCGQFFEGVTGYDYHRTGTFEPPARRCRTPQEMREKGWQINDYGRWGQPQEDQ